MKSKSDFLIDILNDKRLKGDLRDRLLKKVTEEIKHVVDDTDKIWIEIEKLKGSKDQTQSISSIDKVNSISLKALNESKIEDLPDGEYIFLDGDKEYAVKRINKEFEKGNKLRGTLNSRINQDKSLSILNEIAEEFGLPTVKIIKYTPISNLINYEENQIIASENNIDNNSHSNDNTKKHEVNHGQIPIYHNPKDLVSLLSCFSKHGHPFKDSTHEWEYNPTVDNYTAYKDFLVRLDEYKQEIFKLKKENKINPKVFPKIMHFLYTENKDGNYVKKNGIKEQYSWGEFKIKYGWRSDEIKNALEENILAEPFDLALPNPFFAENSQISTFGQVIDLFKSEIEIRKENNQLYEIIKKFKTILGADFLKFELDDSLKGIQFYTDVPLLKSVLKNVFKAIGKRPMYPLGYARVITNDNNNSYSLEILQKDSYNQRITSDNMIKELEDGDFITIKNSLMNICDWSIESTFKDGSYRINYLTSDLNISVKEKINTAEGFKHILTFYR
jgi:hypothetical protein